MIDRQLKRENYVEVGKEGMKKGHCSYAKHSLRFFGIMGICSIDANPKPNNEAFFMPSAQYYAGMRDR